MVINSSWGYNSPVKIPNRSVIPFLLVKGPRLCASETHVFVCFRWLISIFGVPYPKSCFFTRSVFMNSHFLDQMSMFLVFPMTSLGFVVQPPSHVSHQARSLEMDSFTCSSALGSCDAWFQATWPWQWLVHHLYHGKKGHRNS